MDLNLGIGMLIFLSGLAVGALLRPRSPQYGDMRQREKLRKALDK